MDLSKFKQEVARLERLCADDTLPESSLESFVLDNLPAIPVEQYVLKDVLSRNTILMLVRNGTLQLNQVGKGGVRMIQAGEIVDLSRYADIYARLFGKWEQAGWLKIKRLNEAVEVDMQI
jgi:hypothetical protein